jgi:choline dehydrogenase-like flavoprotein
VRAASARNDPTPDRLRLADNPLRYLVAMVSRNLIDRAGKTLAEVAGPNSTVILFGSHARGEASADSDVDFLVIDALRIVDASVMPTVPRGNTNAPTIAIAERAADLIRHGKPLATADVDAASV